MSEDEVVYTDVQFKSPRKPRADAFPPNDTTYAEVRLPKSQPQEPLGIQAGAGEADVPQPAGSKGQRSKAKRESVALMLLCLLLAATSAALGVFYTHYVQNRAELQAVMAERDNVRKNLTDTLASRQQIMWDLSAQNSAIQNNLSEALAEISCKNDASTCPEFSQSQIGKKCLKCESSWEIHAESCYHFSTEKRNWNDSRDNCVQQRAQLVVINSKAEQEFLTNTLVMKMEAPEDKHWIGLTDQQEEGTWVWVDSSPLQTRYWSVNEPDNWTGKDQDGENCARMGEKGGSTDLKCWFDISCKTRLKHICERAASPSVLMCT